MTIRSRMSSILDLIGSERLELFALELKKIAIFVFVHSLASTIFNQSALNLAKIYFKILDEFNYKRLQLFALDLEKLLYLTLFTL